VSQAGSVLLWETMRVTGLGRGLSQGLARWRAPRAVHDPGKIVADLAAAVALGGDCLADIAVLREQPQLAGPVASDPVVSRLVSQLAGDLPRALKAIRSARAAARERAWALAGNSAPGADGGLVTVDLDATIVIAHSEDVSRDDVPFAVRVGLGVLVRGSCAGLGPQPAAFALAGVILGG
jgi:hypothetical protein